MERRFCCPTFEDSYNNHKRRGFSIDVFPPEPLFWLWFRAVDAGREEAFSGLELSTDVSLVTRTRLLFCPWCGKRLDKFYRRTWTLLVREETDTFGIPVEAQDSPSPDSVAP